jgi:hypothetical protein
MQAIVLLIFRLPKKRRILASDFSTDGAFEGMRAVDTTVGIARSTCGKVLRIKVVPHAVTARLAIPIRSELRKSAIGWKGTYMRCLIRRRLIVCGLATILLQIMDSTVLASTLPIVFNDGYTNSIQELHYDAMTYDFAIGSGLYASSTATPTSSSGTGVGGFAEAQVVLGSTSMEIKAHVDAHAVPGTLFSYASSQDAYLIRAIQDTAFVLKDLTSVTAIDDESYFLSQIRLDGLFSGSIPISVVINNHGGSVSYKGMLLADHVYSISRDLTVIVQNGQSNADIDFTTTLTFSAVSASVPEPSSVAMLGLGGIVTLFGALVSSKNVQRFRVLSKVTALIHAQSGIEVGWNA